MVNASLLAAVAWGAAWPRLQSEGRTPPSQTPLPAWCGSSLLAHKEHAWIFCSSEFYCSPVLLWQADQLCPQSSPEKIERSTPGITRIISSYWTSGRVYFSKDFLGSKKKSLFLLIYLPYSLMTENSKGRRVCRKREGISLNRSS